MSKNSSVYELTKVVCDEWSRDAEKNIKAKVEEVLHSRQKELILTLLGFDKHHAGVNSWRVDHCNNRSGNSPIGIILTEAIKDRLDNITGSLELTLLEKSELQKISRDEYLKSFKYEVAQSSRRLGKKHAEDFTKKEVGLALEGAAEKVRLQLMESI